MGRFDVGPSTVDDVLASLDHRGPDGRGVEHLPGASLLHTRLKILDLSDTGAQPMASADRTVWTVCNGEIYNHHDLRRGLEARGHRFRSTCDTEVIPALYLEEGPEFVRRLRGMFALAVFDTRNDTLVLARDRFGIKPLFYGRTAKGLAFASEPGALRHVPGLDLRPDPQAVRDFVSLHVVPAPLTFFRGIRAVEPGQRIVVTPGPGGPEVQVQRFHDWVIAPDPSLTVAEAAGRAGELLDRAVGAQLESDVPLGTLLSGGIDSSLVAAAAVRRDPAMRTFSVRFADAAFDESAAAHQVAAHLGTDHLTLDFESEPATFPGVARILRSPGQPFADTSLFAVGFLARAVRRDVTVALSGDGGDEGFGGYAHYGLLPRLVALLATPRPARTAAAAVIGGVARTGLGPRRPGAIARRFGDLAGAADAVGAVAAVSAWVREGEMARAWAGPGVDTVTRLFTPTWQHDTAGLGRVDRLSALLTEADTRLRLANDYLPKVDTASMAVGLEVRVPFLDEELFAFGLTLPHRLKNRRGTTKPVLRAVADREVPGVARLPKHGFGVPVDRWMGVPCRQQARAAIMGGDAPVLEFLDRSWVSGVLDAFCEGRVPPGVSRQGLFQRAVSLMALHLALDPASAA